MWKHRVDRSIGESSRERWWWRIASVGLAVMLVATACSSDDDDTVSSGDGGDDSSEVEASSDADDADAEDSDDEADAEEPAETPSSDPEDGATVRVALGEDPPHVNPDLSTSNPVQMIGCSVYEGLTENTADGGIQPNLASSWEISDDGTSYTFHLVDAQWQDGEPFTSEDVKYTFEEVSSEFSAIFSRAAEHIASIETPDDETVVINLSEPFGPFMTALGCGQGGAILPEHLFAGTDVAENPATLEAPVGTGPYVLEQWDRGSRITTVRNLDYWDGTPSIERVVYTIIPDPAAMVIALQADEIDLIPGNYLAPNNVPTIENADGLVLQPVGFPPGDDLLYFNMTRDLTSDPEVRKAMLQAVDRDFLLENVYFNIGGVGQSSIPSRIEWAHNPDVDYTAMYPYSPDEAAARLDAAGYEADGGSRFSIDLVLSSASASSVSTAQALQSFWEAIDIDVNIEALETATALERLYADADFDVGLQPLTSYGDPTLGIARQFVSSSITGEPYTNMSQYSNPAVDELFDAAATAADRDQRAEYLYEVQEIIAEDVPSVSLHETQTVDAAVEGLTGLWHLDFRDWFNATMSG